MTQRLVGLAGMYQNGIRRVYQCGSQGKTFTDQSHPRRTLLAQKIATPTDRD